MQAQQRAGLRPGERPDGFQREAITACVANRADGFKSTLVAGCETRVKYDGSVIRIRAR